MFDPNATPASASQLHELTADCERVDGGLYHLTSYRERGMVRWRLVDASNGTTEIEGLTAREMRAYLFGRIGGAARRGLEETAKRLQRIADETSAAIARNRSERPTSLLDLHTTVVGAQIEARAALAEHERGR